MTRSPRRDLLRPQLSSSFFSSPPPSSSIITRASPPSSSSPSSLEASASAWDLKYDTPLPHGVSLTQGPREEMEDFVAVVPRARCGYLYAAVFDGHAGSAAARFLADRLYPALSQTIEETNYVDCELPPMTSTSSDEASNSKDSTQAQAQQNLATASLDGLCCPVDISPALAATFDALDVDLLKYLKSLPDPPERDAGSTATVVLARKGRIVAANVGDSRAVLCRGGVAVDLTTEHRVYGKSAAASSEASRVKAAGGWLDDGRVCGVLAVSRAFGDPGLKRAGLGATLRQGVEDGAWTEEFARERQAIGFEADPVVPTPDVTALATTDRDEFVVVASDGLWDVLPSRDAVRVARAALRKGVGPAGAAAALAEAAVKRRTPDNVAVVVVDLKGDGGWGGGGESGSGGEKKKKKGWSLFGG